MGKANHLGQLAKQVAKAWDLDLEQMSMFELKEINLSTETKLVTQRTTMRIFDGHKHTQMVLGGLNTKQGGDDDESISSEVFPGSPDDAEIMYDEGAGTETVGSTN